MWKLLLLVPLAYAAILIAIFLAQDRLLFPTSMVAGSSPLPSTAERLIVSVGGEDLHGVHIPPAGPATAERPVMLGFGGNAWNAEGMANYLSDMFPEYDVLAFHYRGYRPSGGRPSAAALLSDALVVHDQVAARLGSRRIVAVGFSIGSGVAAHLARHRPIAGVVLATPFDSLKAVAGGHYPWLPVSLLFRHEMDAAKDLRGTSTPTAVIAADRDTIIPPARTEALRGVIKNLAFDRTIAQAGHNDLYDRPDFRDAMAQAVDAVLAADHSSASGGPALDTLGENDEIESM